MGGVLSVILGGGRGERLFPLTRQRAKPAVPFGGKYRLVDIPISNCINSGLRQIYILTQFNSTSLHRHVSQTYLFDTFSRGFAAILAAEQTPESLDWYQGTADAVRKNFLHFRTHEPSHYLILAGDQLYRMDYGKLLARHQEAGADITVAVTLVRRERASTLGILKVDARGRIVEFLEKPGPTADISGFRSPATLAREDEQGDGGPYYLASTGIYVFTAEVMERALNNEYADFGHQIIPDCIPKMNVYAYAFPGYWEDIGTVSSFYEANLMLTEPLPPFNFYDEAQPIYTHRRDLPASKINACLFHRSIAADGCIVNDARISNSIIGIRSIVGERVSLEGVVGMGADFFETLSDKQRNRTTGFPDVGIGAGSHVRRAIIDKNARIGEYCRIGVDDMARVDGDHGTHFVQNGIIVIPKNCVIPPGSVL